MRVYSAVTKKPVSLLEHVTHENNTCGVLHGWLQPMEGSPNGRVYVRLDGRYVTEAFDPADFKLYVR